MKDDLFYEFILDQLRDLEGVSGRAMFGGHGLYQLENFFGIVSDGRLYFKTDQKTAPQYRTRGMQPFTPSAKQILKNYLEVPANVIEDRDELVKWAARAARCGIRESTKR